MDEATIEAKGITPLKADLARIAAIKDKKTLAAVLGGNVRADVDALNSTDFYTDNVSGPVGLAVVRRHQQVCAVPAAGRPGHAGSPVLSSATAPR